MDLVLTGRAFAVTAASSGLGYAAAEQLVAEGARAVLVGRRAELLADHVAAFALSPCRLPHGVHVAGGRRAHAGLVT